MYLYYISNKVPSVFRIWKAQLCINTDDELPQETECKLVCYTCFIYYYPIKTTNVLQCIKLDKKEKIIKQFRSKQDAKKR